MSTRAQRLAELRASRGGVSAELIANVLADYGFQWTQGGTSHRVYSHPKYGRSFTVPMHNLVRAAYVKLALQQIDAVIKAEAEEAGE